MSDKIAVLNQLWRTRQEYQKTVDALGRAIDNLCEEIPETLGFCSKCGAFYDVDKPHVCVSTEKPIDRI